MTMTHKNPSVCRGWIETLTDPDSFIPLIPPTDKGAGFGDEILTGFAKIDGKTIALWASVPEKNGGYISSKGAIKIRRLMDRAHDLGIPIVSLMSSLGISIEEGVRSGEEYSRVLLKTSEISGIIPQIACIMGVNIGAPAYSAALQDLTIFNRLRSHLCVSSPGVVKEVLGQESTFADLGGSKMHSSTTGLAHFVDSKIDMQLARCRWLIQFFPSNHKDDPAQRMSRPPLSSLPDIPFEPQVPFDICLLINAITDNSEWMEYSQNFGQTIVCGWSYIGGFPVGIIANQSLYKSGTLDVEGSQKAARFIRICDSYNIPILTLIDCPGFMPGIAEEQGGILQAGATLIRSMMTQVPKLSIVVRKCYGAAAIVLAQTKNWNGDLVLALESSRNAVMGFSAAKNVIYKEDARDTDELKREYFEKYERPDVSFSLGLVDEIITACQLRSRLIQHLDILSQKRPNAIPAVRGIDP